MTERELFDRCKALGVCGRGLVLRPTDEWAYNGFTVEAEIAYAILCGRLAAKVREKHRDAYVYRIPSGLWMNGNSGKIIDPAPTELGAWLALAEKVCKPAETPAQKMRWWAARMGNAYGLAYGRNVVLNEDGFGGSFHQFCWGDDPLHPVHRGMKPGEIREISESLSADWTGDEKRALVDLAGRSAIDAEFEAECNAVRAAVFARFYSTSRSDIETGGLAKDAADAYRTRFGKGGGDDK